MADESEQTLCFEHILIARMQCLEKLSAFAFEAFVNNSCIITLYILLENRDPLFLQFHDQLACFRVCATVFRSTIPVSVVQAGDLPVHREKPL